MSNYPSFNDREFDLLKKIAASLADIAENGGGGGGGGVTQIVAGSGISIDQGTGIVTISATGGSGAVDSVFGRTGTVSAEAADYAAFYAQLAVSNTFLGVNTFSGSFIFPPATVTIAANAGTIDTTKVHSIATNGADTTLTPSSAGTLGQQIGVIFVNTDTAAHTVTGAGSASTISYTAAASSTTMTYWRSSGSAWTIVGGAVTINDLSTITPASGDLIALWDISGGTVGKATKSSFLADLGTPTTLNLSNATALPISALTAGVLAANMTLGESTGQIVLDPTLSADGTYSGIIEAGTAGATLAFGDLVYFSVTDSRWELADADAASTSGVMLGMCVLAAAGDGSATNILRWGKIRADANFPTLTVGAPVYVSTTPGDVQVAQPDQTDDVIRIVGFAATADVLLFQPSNDYMTHI